MKQLPDSLRDALKTTKIGTLVTSTQELIDALHNSSCIVAIGDYVASSVIPTDLPICMIIVDYIHKRKKISDDQRHVLESFGEQTYQVENPPACISDQLWNSIEQGLQQMRTSTVRITVQGEEDLASLAVISLASSDVTVIYGVPDKGVLIVPITPYHKKVVNDVLEKM